MRLSKGAGGGAADTDNGEIFLLSFIEDTVNEKKR